MFRDETRVDTAGHDRPDEKRSELLARIERLEQLVLSGEATLDDYGALALAQQEWERGL